MSKIIIGTDLKFSIKVDPIKVEGQTEKLSLKDCNFEVEMFVDLGNDDQIAIMLNKDSGEEVDLLAYDKMQEWREWASIVAKKILEVLQ